MITRKDPHDPAFYESIRAYDEAFAAMLEAIEQAAKTFRQATGGVSVRRITFFKGGGVSVDVGRGEGEGDVNS